MLIALFKRAIKAAFHEAVEEGLEEAGLSEESVEEYRQHRLDVVARRELESVNLLRARLGLPPKAEPRPVLIASAAQTTPATETNCPAPNADDEAFENLMTWIDKQRQEQLSWANITQAAWQAGYGLSEDALRKRYQRWRDKAGQGENETSGRSA